MSYHPEKKKKNQYPKKLLLCIEIIANVCLIWEQTFGCQPQSFPITYLGAPLFKGCSKGFTYGLFPPSGRWIRYSFFDRLCLWIPTQVGVESIL